MYSSVTLDTVTLLCNYHYNPSPELCHLPKLKFCIYHMKIINFYMWTQKESDLIYSKNINTGQCNYKWFSFLSFQFSSVAQFCPTLCDPMDCTPGLPVHHQFPEFTQTHVHWIGDAIQPSHPLSSPSPPAFNLSQHQGLFKWVSSLHQVAEVLEFQLQHQSFQRTLRTDLL